MSLRVRMVWGVLFTLLLVVAVSAYRYRALLGAAMDQPQMFRAPELDTVAPALPADLGEVAILSFSKTNGFRHLQAIPASTALLDELGREQGWQFYHTENGAIFTDENLARFALVVLNHKSGTVWTEAQRAAFKSYVEGGGTVVALHAAGGDAGGYDWAWYLDEVLRAQFVDHPMRQHIQPARLVVEDRSHPATQHLDATWQRADEWYNFEESPRSRVNVLVSIDETTYDPETSPMGADHPMVWWHEVGEGRVLYSALGHTVESYAEPAFKRFIAGAIRWGLGQETR